MEGMRMVSPKDTLIAKIRSREAVVGIIGLGYVGLPLAVLNASLGFEVIGVERNPVRVASVNEGKSYIPDVPSEVLRELVGRGLIRAYRDFSRVKDMDVIVIAVPTPITENLSPELKYVRGVTSKIAERLRPGQLVSLESTTYPGTTDEVMLPLLTSSGLKPDEEFFLAYAPERVDPGNERYSPGNTTRVLGAIGPNSLEVATEYYSILVERVITVSSPKVAEMTKLFENTFRAVNIALVNEMAMLCDRMGLNVWEVLDAAFTKPFGIMRFYPGPGVGGHCIPVDPFYLEWKAREYNFTTRFIALAGEINRRMPEFVLSKALKILNDRGLSLKGTPLLLLGVTYKPNVPDIRNSPSIELMRLFRRWGAKVDYYDPLIPELNLDGEVLSSIDIGEVDLGAYEMVIITTAHSGVDYEGIVRRAKLVFDTRNATRGISSDNIVLL